MAAMLGVWQGVPQIYVELIGAWRRTRPEAAGAGERRTYLLALAYLAGPPVIMLWFKQPVVLVVTFSIAGAFFMPFLAATLLYLNNRRDWMRNLASGRLGNAALLICLVVFAAVCVQEIVGALRP